MTVTAAQTVTNAGIAVARTTPLDEQENTLLWGGVYLLWGGERMQWGYFVNGIDAEGPLSATGNGIALARATSVDTTELTPEMPTAATLTGIVLARATEIV